jgi:probable F420-dependent oxidoreductase
MKFWLHIHNTEPEEGVELAVLAEKLGFAGVLGDDHWYMPVGSASADPDAAAPMPWETIFPDMFVFGASVLARTTTLGYGTCVLVLANRSNPLIVAKACSTLARVSNDRFTLGVGIGWMQEEYQIAGIEWTSRGARTEEMIAVLRKLWGGGSVEHHGRFVDFPPTFALPTPKRPIPIFIGARAPNALRRAGRIADGWMGQTSTLDSIPAQIALINEGRRAAGREREPFDFMVGLQRGADGSWPTRDDYHRAEDMGVTLGHFGPIDHVLGKPRTTYAEKVRTVEQFAERVFV